MELSTHTDLIGLKSRLYSNYRVDYDVSTSRTWFERVVLYVLSVEDPDGGFVTFRDQSEYLATWFNKRDDIW